MTRKQSQFVTEYLKDFNATRACIRAGYSTRTAAAIAVGLLKKVEVSEAIHREQSALRSAAVMSADEAREILTRIARAKLPDLLNEDGTVDVDKLKSAGQELCEYVDEDTATGGRRRRVKLLSAIHAMERLAKMCGWESPSAIDVTSGGQPLRTEIVIVPRAQPDATG